VGGGGAEKKRPAVSCCLMLCANNCWRSPALLSNEVFFIHISTNISLLSQLEMLSGLFTTSPKTVEPALLSFELLSGEQKLTLDAFHSEYPESRPEILLGFLKHRNFDLQQAMSQYATYLNFIEKTSLPTINLISKFIREPCDGGIFLLEKKGQDCARDKQGRPIIVSIGMLYGSDLEMQQQLTYALNRAQTYGQHGKIMANCTVIEVFPRKGANTTFRFPDNKIRALMDHQKQYFPGSLSSVSHFCGVPSYVEWAFVLTKPFMDAETYNNMILKADFSHLKDYVTPENMLEQWGGTYSFCIDEYIHWRAEVISAL